MPRMARVVVPGWPHHVTQRGNHRQSVFFSDRDREVYLRRLLKYLGPYGTGLIGYCLMSNHVHLIAVPERLNSLEKGVGRTNNDYSRWQNLECDRTGHLWQSRFFSCPVDPSEVWRVLAYVELNPVRAGLVGNAGDWKWSSAKAHLSGTDETGLLDMQTWKEHFDPNTWAEFLRQKQGDKELCHQIRTATQTGRPFAAEGAVERLEARLGKRLRPRKKGRPSLKSTN